MKLYPLCFSSIVLIVVIFAGCSSPTETMTKTVTQATTETIDLNGVDEIIQTEQGKPFWISLKSNPSTGYIWSETHSASWLQLLGKTYVPDVAEPTSTGLPIIMVGGGGTDNFSFMTSQKGATLVVFKYARVTGTAAEQKVFLIVVE
jgi:predicted secreted protein